MSDKMQIEELVRAKLGGAEIEPSGGAWKGVQRQLRSRQFLRFDPGQFNIFYLGAVLVAAAALVTLVTRNSPGQATPETVPGAQFNTQQPVTGPESAAGAGTDGSGETDARPLNTPSESGPQNKETAGNRASEAAPGDEDHPSASGPAERSGDLHQDGGEGGPGQPVRQTLVTYFTASAGSGCVPLRVSFFNASVNASSVTWSFGTGDISTENNPEYLFAEPGRYTVTLRAVGRDGVSEAYHQLIEVYPVPRAGFEIEEGPEGSDGAGPLQLTNYSEGAFSYAWDLVDRHNRTTGTWSSNEFQPALNIPGSPQEGHSVRLVALNEYGCSDTLIAQIPAVTATVRPTLRFPTAFSPGLTGPTGGSYEPGERRIDIFYPIISEIPAEYHLQIFSRLGELVYETREIYRGWDGYHLEERSAGGVYIWIADGSWEDGSTFSVKGDVTLIWGDRRP
jgi:PKD repeat protein